MQCAANITPMGHRRMMHVCMYACVCVCGGGGKEDVHVYVSACGYECFVATIVTSFIFKNLR